MFSDWKAMLASFREYLGEAPFAYSDEDFDFLDTNLMRFVSSVFPFAQNLSHHPAAYSAIIASAADLRRPILRENPLLEHYAHDDPSVRLNEIMSSPDRILHLNSFLKK